MKTSYKFSLAALFFIALAGTMIGLYYYNLGPKDLKKVKPDYKITATDLLKAFESDENASTSKYLNKVMEITGIIQSVKSGENNSLSISLKTDSDFSSVICTFEGNPDTSEFNVGEQISLRGECSGFLMDVLLNNCVVIK